MANQKEGEPVSVRGNPLVCPICGNNEFWHRWTLMNTPGLTLFDLDWANRQAENFVCDECGHVMWFLG